MFGTSSPRPNIALCLFLEVLDRTQRLWILAWMEIGRLVGYNFLLSGHWGVVWDADFRSARSTDIVLKETLGGRPTQRGGSAKSFIPIEVHYKSCR